MNPTPVPYCDLPAGMSYTLPRCQHTGAYGVKTKNGHVWIEPDGTVDAVEDTEDGKPITSVIPCIPLGPVRAHQVFGISPVAGDSGSYQAAVEYKTLLTFEKFRRTNAARCESSFHPIEEWSPTDWACALGGEAGEALNLVKKLRRMDSMLSNRGKDSGLTKERIIAQVGDELGDIVAYADLLATRLGLKLGDCVASKFNAISAEIGSNCKV